MAVQGYPHLASHICASPSSLIIRSFSSLAARNILYLQAELVQLEEHLQELELRDSNSTEGREARYAKDWRWLRRSVLEGNSEQWETMMDIRQKLKEYNDTIFQQARMSKFPRAVNYDLRTLQGWLDRSNMGNTMLKGVDRNVWGFLDGSVRPAGDLLSINAAPLKDPFSSWVSYLFVEWFYHRVWPWIRKTPRDEESGILVYEEEVVIRWTGWVSAAVASAFPVASTVVLYCVGNAGVRLGLTALFTFLFSVALMALTTARSMEVFIATAAFAAVEVVFISGNTTKN